MNLNEKYTTVEKINAEKEKPEKEKTEKGKTTIPSEFFALGETIQQLSSEIRLLRGMLAK